MGNIARGDLFWADLEPTIGSEQGGTRPVLIIQNDMFNIYGPTTIIAPLTSKQLSKKYLTSIFVSKKDLGMKKDSTILLNQIRTIDKSRIRKRISTLPNEIMNRVDFAIATSLGLN